MQKADLFDLSAGPVPKFIPEHRGHVTKTLQNLRALARAPVEQPKF